MTKAEEKRREREETRRRLTGEKPLPVGTAVLKTRHNCNGPPTKFDIQLEEKVEVIVKPKSEGVSMHDEE